MFFNKFEFEEKKVVDINDIDLEENNEEVKGNNETASNFDDGSDYKVGKTWLKLIM